MKSKFLPFLIAIVLCGIARAQSPARADEVIIVRGANGTEEYAKRFDAEVAAWQMACTKGALHSDVVHSSADLKAKLLALGAKKDGALWLVMIGHGTFDGREARFNVEGPDFTALELADWLKPVQRELVVVNTASASGAFMKPLAGAHRVIVTATKSGDEVFYPRFGESMAKAIAGELAADRDQDQQVSLLEAFLYAAKQAALFYETEQRIATEHALIEDNGDGTGTRSESFEGVRAKDPKADGLRAHQLALVLNEDEMKLPADLRTKRDGLEAKVRELVNKKSTMSEDDYYREAERLFLEIARLMKQP